MNESQLPETMLTMLSAWAGSREQGRLYPGASWKTKCKVPLGQPAAAPAILIEGAGIRAEILHFNIHILVKPTDTSMARNSLHWSYQHGINFTLLIVTKPRARLGRQEHTRNFYTSSLASQLHARYNQPFESARIYLLKLISGKHILILTWRPPSFHI